MKNTIKSVCVIIGTIIGAGFASGKEIVIFFNRYGIKGLYGIIISSILTGAIIYCTLKQIRNSKTENYKNYLEQLNMPLKLKEIINIIINIFLLVTFYIMIAGFCTYFKQEFNISQNIIGIIICIICYFTLINHIEGITKISIGLIPILIFIIIIIGIKNNIYGSTTIIKQQINGNWILSALEYASYNSIILIPMLIGLKKYSYKIEKQIAITTTIIFLFLSVILYQILQSNIEIIQKVELPLICIAKQYGNLYSYMYGIVIIAAIYTSAISAGYGFIENCSQNSKKQKIICAMICVTAIPVANIGFSNLVSLLYPVFGLLGLIQIIYILFAKRVEKKYKN